MFSRFNICCQHKSGVWILVWNRNTKIDGSHHQRNGNRIFIFRDLRTDERFQGKGMRTIIFQARKFNSARFSIKLQSIVFCFWVALVLCYSQWFQADSDRFFTIRFQDELFFECFVAFLAYLQWMKLTVCRYCYSLKACTRFECQFLLTIDIHHSTCQFRLVDFQNDCTRGCFTFENNPC